VADLSGWPYYKVISITGQSGAGVDYQVKLSIGDSAGGDFHLENHCTNFPQDIRITDNDGVTLLDHWVEDITADPIIVHVKVDDDLGSNQTIRVYYGKSGETTASHIGNTFIFGDDFSGDLSKWTLTQSSAGNVAILSNEVRILSNQYWNANGMTSVDTINRPCVIEWNTRSSSGIQSNMQGYSPQPLNFNSGLVFYHDGTANQIKRLLDSANSGSLGAADFTVDSKSKIILKTTQGYTLFFAGTQIEDSATWSTSTNKIMFLTQAATSYIDNVFVRKYNSPEPAFSGAGAEQAAGGWSDKIIGVSGPGKVNGIVAADISKILGVS